MKRIGYRWPCLVGILLAVMALAGCENLGESGVRDELSRVQREKGFAVISTGSKRAVFAVRGQRIVVAPPDGYCLDEGSVGVSRSSAFALVADCVPQVVNGTGDQQEISLPRSFPGILTISVSGEPAFDKPPQALDDFAIFVSSDAGVKLRGRGNGAVPGKVVATRKVGGALYALVEGRQTAKSFLAPRFWRTFININARLLLVTVSSFSDRPIAEEAMMGFLAQQIARLRDVNDLPDEPEEAEIARLMIETLDLKSGTDTLVVGPASTPSEISDGINPAQAPLPPARATTSPQRASDSAAGAGSTSKQAPSSAPIPRRRPIEAQNGSVAPPIVISGGNVEMSSREAPSRAPIPPRRPG